MFIGYFTERPYQDRRSGYFGLAGRDITDLSMSNGSYHPGLGADLYNRYLDEKVYAEEMGFDGLMLNEHHSTPFCMGGVMNIEAAILARITKRAKIVLLGNILPIWDDPLWLAEMLAEIDMISRGRLVSGWVRGTGRESVAHNAQPPFNWERFQEAHDFVVTAWTKPGPVPLGGRALPLPLREPVGAAVPEPAPAHLDSGRHVAQHGGVVGQAPVPVHHARHRARAHTAVVPLLRRVREGARLRGRLPAPRLSVQGARGRDRGAGRAGRAPLRRGPVQPVPGGQPGQRQELHPEPAGPDVAHPAPAHRQHLRRRGARAGIASTRTARSSPPTSTAPTSSRSRRCPSSAARRRRSSPRSARCSRRCARARSSSGTAMGPWTTTTRCAPCASWARRSSPPAARWPRSWTCPGPSTSTRPRTRSSTRAPVEPAGVTTGG